MKKIIFSISIAVLTICFMQIRGQTTHQNLDVFFHKKMKKSDRIGMQVAYISKGELIWTGAYGLKTFGTNSQVNDSTLFMVASISKPVTALAMMKLVDEGKIDLDRDINYYLPFDVRNPNMPDSKITSRMLLSHVSSIKDNWAILEQGYTIDNGGDSKVSLEDFLREYLLYGGDRYNKEFNFLKAAPGTYERYSNVGYGLIGLIVEKVSGKPFNQYMKEAIFMPLKMTNTYWFLSEIPHKNLATPHNMPYKETDFKGTQILNHYGYPGYPSGQLRTTVSDYAQVLKLMVNDGKIDDKQFLSPDIMKEFLRVQYPQADEFRAISWSYNEFESKIYYMFMARYPSHTGLDPGMSSVVSFDLETKSAVLIFSNSPTTTWKSEKIIYLNMVKKLFKEAQKSNQ